VQANENITLKPEDFHAFLAALDTPAQPNPALKKRSSAMRSRFLGDVIRYPLIRQSR